MTNSEFHTLSSWILPGRITAAKFSVLHDWWLSSFPPLLASYASIHVIRVIVLVFAAKPCSTSTYLSDVDHCFGTSGPSNSSTVLYLPSLYGWLCMTIYGVCARYLYYCTAAPQVIIACTSTCRPTGTRGLLASSSRYSNYQVVSHTHWCCCCWYQVQYQVSGTSR